MELWNSIDAIPCDCGETVLTIGKFDGIHLGHQALIAKTIELAGARAARPALLTFDRHPDALLHPERALPSLIGPHQKEALIREAGIGALLTLHFDHALAQLSPEEFVQRVLAENLHARHLVMGEDFRFGAKGAGDIHTLIQLGMKYDFEVLVVPPVLVDGERVSSTRVRELLDAGDVAKAANFLGRRHTTTGVVEHGKKLGRELGFPTANLSRSSEGYLPLDGVYAGWLYVNGQRHPAAISIGTNETVEAVPRLLEAYVLDREDLDLYDLEVTIEYVDFIRPTAKFDGLPELIRAIEADVAQVRARLKSEGK